MTNHPLGLGNRLSKQDFFEDPSLPLQIYIRNPQPAFPLHSHSFDELVIILNGTANHVINAQKFPVKSGDIIFTPPGKGTAHQIVNTSAAELRYLAFSSTDNPEVCYYPDSGKYGAYSFNGGPGVRFMAHEDSAADYWDGED